MRRIQAVRKLIVLAALAAALAPARAPAWQRVGDVEVTVQPLANLDRAGGQNFGVSHGYVEYRVRLKNFSDKERTVHLTFPAETRNDRTSGTVSTRTVAVTAGQESFVSLFEPPTSTGESTMQVNVDGVKDGRVIPVGSMRTSPQYGYGYGNPTNNVPAVLLSRGVPQDFREQGVTPQPSASGSYSGNAAPPDALVMLRSDVAVAQWSPNWLGYSCYDAILVTAQEAVQMPEQVQAAIRRYVECGGMLLVHGTSLPAVFTQGGASDGQGGYYVGLGRVAATSTRGEPTWKDTYRRLVSRPPETYHPVQRPGQLRELLVGETAVPVRGLFFLLLVFAVGIGPVNIWLLSRYRRRIWLWWNVPAISVATCLAVFGYSMFSEGWSSRGRTATLTVLDERCHRATTIGYISYYCPLTPSRGLHFGADTEVTTLPRNDPRYNYNPYRRGGEELGPSFVDWSADQHLTSGWISARVPAYFQIRKNEDRRERLSVETTADGHVKVVNALGADIRLLRVADATGHMFEGRNIPAGAEYTLTSVHGSAMLKPDTLRSTFAITEWLGQLDSWQKSDRLDQLVAPGGYAAVLVRSPFIESPLAGAGSEDTVAIVCGTSKSPEK
jgi:hypothetical protein